MNIKLNRLQTEFISLEHKLDELQDELYKLEKSGETTPAMQKENERLREFIESIGLNPDHSFTVGDILDIKDAIEGVTLPYRARSH